MDRGRDTTEINFGNTVETCNIHVLIIDTYKPPYPLLQCSVVRARIQHSSSSNDNFHRHPVNTQLNILLSTLPTLGGVSSITSLCTSSPYLA
jgi:hypothetical protein